MAFIQFELDALGGAHMVAGLVGVPYQQVTGGLIELWAWCWRAGSELATPEQIAGTMAIPHPGLVNALVAGGFLEKVEAGWRVRGSSRYLRITERQEVAGRARAASAKRVGGRFVSPATDQPLTSNRPATDQPLTSNSPASHQQLTSQSPAITPVSPAAHQPVTSQSPATDQPLTSRSPALTPITDHRSPIRDKALEDMSTGVDLSQSVFDHWRSVMNHTGAKFDAKRRRAVQQALKLGYTEQQLKQAVDGCKASPYHQGQNKDSQVYDSLTLIVRDAEHIDRFIGIAVNGPPRGDVRKGPQRAEDQGWTANDKTGVVSVSQTQEAIGWK